MSSNKDIDLTQFDFNAFQEDAISQLKSGHSLTGKDGVLTPLIKKILEAALEGELEAHLSDCREQGLSDDTSWLIDGLTTIGDVMQTLAISSFPEVENYETIAGFMMYILRKVPKRTDFIIHGGYKFEVVDIDNFKIDQLLVTRL